MTDPRELLDQYGEGDSGAYHYGSCDVPREECAPKAFAALRAVLDLHQREDIVTFPEPDAPPGVMGERAICPECSAERPYADWPCPNVQAITTALEAADG